MSLRVQYERVIRRLPCSLGAPDAAHRVGGPFSCYWQNITDRVKTSQCPLSLRNRSGGTHNPPARAYSSGRGPVSLHSRHARSGHVRPVRHRKGPQTHSFAFGVSKRTCPSSMGYTARISFSRTARSFGRLATGLVVGRSGRFHGESSQWPSAASQNTRSEWNVWRPPNAIHRVGDPDQPLLDGKSHEHSRGRLCYKAWRRITHLTFLPASFCRRAGRPDPRRGPWRGP
jgi:hypothetical protein